MHASRLAVSSISAIRKATDASFVVAKTLWHNAYKVPLAKNAAERPIRWLPQELSDERARPTRPADRGDRLPSGIVIYTLEYNEARKR